MRTRREIERDRQIFDLAKMIYSANCKIDLSKPQVSNKDLDEIAARSIDAACVFYKFDYKK